MAAKKKTPPKPPPLPNFHEYGVWIGRHDTDHKPITVGCLVKGQLSLQPQQVYERFEGIVYWHVDDCMYRVWCYRHDLNSVDSVSIESIHFGCPIHVVEKLSEKALEKFFHSYMHHHGNFRKYPY